jgi:hypothetical protein
MGERKNDGRRILALDTRKRAISFYIGVVLTAARWSPKPQEGVRIPPPVPTLCGRGGMVTQQIANLYHGSSILSVHSILG